jgi:hypothetical protein
MTLVKTERRSETLEQMDKDALQLRMSWMQALETALHRSLRALIDLDLEGLRSATAEQILLAGELAMIVSRDSRAQKNPEPAGDDKPPIFVFAADLPGELRSSEKRILDALRLQSAVLARSQRKQRVLANMLAGAGLPYGPLPARRLPFRS